MFGKQHAHRIALALLVIGGTMPTAAVAQEGRPLLKSDLVRMMTASNYTATEMAAIVRMKCVGFEPTQRDRSQLERLPNADAVMVEVDRCVSRPRPVATEEKELDPTPPKPRARIELEEIEVASPVTSAPLSAEPAARKTVMPAEYSSSTKVKPRLENWEEVSAAFLREYRPMIRTPGTVVLTLKVGADGLVLDAEVKESTGAPAMNEAALRVTSVMQFSPAKLGSTAVESLTELPFHFAAN